MRWRAIFVSVAFVLAATSCSLASPNLDLAFDREGRLTIRTERVWRWFMFPARAEACLAALRVYDENEMVWQIVTDGCSEDAFPITYGVAPSRFTEVTAAKPLVRGRRYGIIACGEYPLDTRMDFILPTSGFGDIATETAWENLMVGPQQREDRQRWAAMRRGEQVPRIDDCTRLPV